MKIAVIGFGAAAIGFIERLKNENHSIVVFEKSQNIYSSSISGIRADGKLFVSSEMGGDIQVDIELQKKLVDFYIANTCDNNVEKGNSFSSESAYFQKFYEKGFMPVSADFYHIGTDQLKMVLSNIYKNFTSFPNIEFRFGKNVTGIRIVDDKAFINDENEEFDLVIVAVGRSGHKLVNTIIKEYPKLIIDNTKVDLGIRYELPNHIVEDINKEMYEFKVKYKSKTGYMVRTFCNNPSGYVVIENYDDFVTVNGHAKMKQKSRNTNFAILVTIQLTEPFNDPIGYGSHIANMSNLLAGEGKVILQTYENFKNSKRTKNLYRVLPTLEKERFILGDINLAFPRRIIESIIDFIENLNEVIPGIASPDNLIYAPEIKFYSNLLDNEKLGNLKLIGDCSGYTRSIIYATAHGYMMAQSIIEKKNQ